MGQGCNEEKLKKIIADVDDSGAGVIDWTGFLKIMRNQYPERQKGTQTSAKAVETKPPSSPTTTPAKTTTTSSPATKTTTPASTPAKSTTAPAKTTTSSTAPTKTTTTTSSTAKPTTTTQSSSTSSTKPATSTQSSSTSSTKPATSTQPSTASSKPATSTSGSTSSTAPAKGSSTSFGSAKPSSTTTGSNSSVGGHRVTNPPCAVCQKAVYPIEVIQALDGAYHKACFRCQEEGCGLVLSLKTFKGVNGKLYCQKHVPVHKPSQTHTMATLNATSAPKISKVQGIKKNERMTFAPGELSASDALDNADADSQ